MKLNSAAFARAKALIASGKVNRTASWSMTAADENKILGPDGDNWSAYAKCHLAINSEAEEETKDHYHYPVIKGGEVYRAGVIAAESRAGANKEEAIKKAAKELLDLIDKNKKDSADYRCDYVDRIWPGNGNVDEALKQTPEGFYTGKVIATNIGVFPYLKADGSISYELRCPEEVFDEDSIASLAGKPITNDHPPELVTPDNWEKYAIGSVGEGISRDDTHLVAPVSIQKADGIQAMRQGRRALSCGYTSNTVDHAMSYPIMDWQGKQPGAKNYPCPGVYLGSHYDRIQTNIRYNHLAIVNKGRAGDEAVLRMDSAAAVMVDPQNPNDGHRADRSNSNMKTFNLDGANYEADEGFIAAFQSLRNDKDTVSENLDEALEKLDAKKQEMDAKQAEYDKCKAELDAKKEELSKLQNELKTMKDEAPKQLDAAVQARVALVDTAKLAGVEVKPDTASIDLMKAVVLKVSPSAKLDGASDAYLQARFDAAVETLQAEDKNKGRRDASDIPPRTGDSSDHQDAAPRNVQEAHTKYDEALAGAWKK